MYSLNCKYYTVEFNTIEDLIEAVMINGMDPNYEILHNGNPTNEYLINLIQP